MSLLKDAYEIGDRVSQTGFDWNSIQEALDKVKEELYELETASTLDNQKEELGDLLFSIAQLARHMGFAPEVSLQQANQKFLKRYQSMLTLCQKSDKMFHSLSRQEKEQLWQTVKTQA